VGIELWRMCGSLFDRADKSVVFLPVGSFERHGDHLPLGTDTIEALYVARAIAERVGGHVLPPIWYGVSPHLSRFGGTITVPPEVLMRYVEAVLRGAASMGYRLVVVVNGHGGNSEALRAVAREVALSMGVEVAVIDWWRELGVDARRRLFTEPGHAGEDETSAMLFIDPDSVCMDRASDHTPPRGVVEVLTRVSLYTSRVVEELYPHAVLGGASKGSAEKGREWLREVVEEGAAVVRRLIEVLGIAKGTG